MRGVRGVGSWRRVRGRWLILRRLLHVRVPARLPVFDRKPGTSLAVNCNDINRTLTAMRFTVIVRRVVAARRAHAATLAPTNPQLTNNLFGHGHSSSRTQPLSPHGNKEATDLDFPSRPGAKKTKRGGFWARFKCW